MANNSDTTPEETPSAERAASSTPFGRLGRLSYVRSTHAPLYERYMPSGDFEAVGLPGEYGPIDPETDAEYRALGGLDHTYNRDYKVGNSYPETVFIRAEDVSNNSLSHDVLEAGLRNHDLWSDALVRVLLPKGIESGTATWYAAFQFRPPERAPRLQRVEHQLERVLDDPDIYQEGPVLDARVWHD